MALAQEHSVAAAAGETASRSVTGAISGSRNSRNNAWRRQKNVLWLWKHFLAASQDRPVAPTASKTTSGSVAEAFCGSSSSGSSVQERSRSDRCRQQPRKQRLGRHKNVLLLWIERLVASHARHAAPAAAEKTSRGVTGAPQERPVALAAA